MTSNNQIFEQYLKEQSSQGDYFSKIEDVNIQDLDVESAQAHIKWSAEIEYRSWGIKDITPIIFSGKLYYETEGAGQREFDLPGEFKIETSVDARADNQNISLFPKSLEVNLAAKHIVIFF